METFAPTRIYLSTPESTQNSVEESDYENILLIHSDIRADLLQEQVLWEQRELPYYQHPERLILDVNMIGDMKKAS
jgi:hypothetical protein